MLALLSGLSARHLEQHFPCPSPDSYYQGLQRSYTGQGAHLHLVPYSCELSSATALQLKEAIVSAFGPRATLHLSSPSPSAKEDALPASAVPGTGATLAVALFSLAATPKTRTTAASSAPSPTGCPPARPWPPWWTKAASWPALAASPSARKNAAGPGPACSKARRRSRLRPSWTPPPPAWPTASPASSTPLPARKPPGILQPATIQLSLVSHTNTGKTTLARSLIGRDVGEIRDEAHVTALAECHRLIDTTDGHVLNLWDTPGFGDSARLIKRLRLQGTRWAGCSPKCGTAGATALVQPAGHPQRARAGRRGALPGQRRREAR